MDEKQRRKRKHLIIAIIFLLLLIFIILTCSLFKKDKPVQEPQGGGQGVEQQEPDDDKIVIGNSKEEETPPVEETPEEDDDTEEKPADKAPPKPSKDTSAEPEPEPVAPIKTDPLEAVRIALNKMTSLKGDSKQTEINSKLSSFVIEVSDTETADDAAAQIIEAIKTKLGYNEATADGTVPVGNPNPFSYDYKLTYTNGSNGKYYYTFEYRFRQQYYSVSEKGYDTNKLVSDIVAYLTSEGKEKFDYHSSGTAESQPVIILFEDDYEVALEKAKGQVSSACSSYSSFDFEYRALTIAGRGQEQKKALLFNIYYK